MPQKQPPASTAVSLAGADVLGASTAATGIALSIASAVAASWRPTPVSAARSSPTERSRTIRFISVSVRTHSIIRLREQTRYNGPQARSPAQQGSTQQRPDRTDCRNPERVPDHDKRSGTLITMKGVDERSGGTRQHTRCRASKRQPRRRQRAQGPEQAEEDRRRQHHNIESTDLVGRAQHQTHAHFFGHTPELIDRQRRHHCQGRQKHRPEYSALAVRTYQPFDQAEAKGSDAQGISEFHPNGPELMALIRSARTPSQSTMTATDNTAPSARPRPSVRLTVRLGAGAQSTASAAMRSSVFTTLHPGFRSQAT